MPASEAKISMREKNTIALRQCQDTGLGDAMRKDSSLASNMSRELEFVYTEVIEQEHPDKPFAMGEIIPIDSRAGPGAATYVYYEMGGTATAVVLNTYADSELPEVGLFARRHVGQMESMGNKWGYNVEDLDAAAMSPTTGNLLTMKPRLAERAHVELWNTKGLFGDDDFGWNGFLNHPNVPQLASATSWSTFASQADIDACLEEVRLMVETPDDLTNSVHIPNRMLVPKFVFNSWQFQRVSFGAGDLSETILTWLQKSFNIEIMWLLELDSSKGDLTDSRAMVYKGGDMDIVAWVRTKDFTQHEGRWNGLRFDIPCTSKFGGVKFSQPLSAAMTTGVT